MWLFTLKIGVAAIAIAFSAWLAGRKPELAGFIIALPLASILALAFSHLEHRDASASITFAKSIMVGVPVSWLFFLPFFFAEKYEFGFWISFLGGILLLLGGFFIHSFLVRQI
jgi:hypothetical protein